jgi:hypothetical protein
MFKLLMKVIRERVTRSVTLAFNRKSFTNAKKVSCTAPHNHDRMTS